MTRPSAKQGLLSGDVITTYVTMVNVLKALTRCEEIETKHETSRTAKYEVANVSNLTVT